MKQKGKREQPPAGTVRHHETTRDERIKVITFDEVGMSWTQIGKKLNIDSRTVQKANGIPSNHRWSGRPPIFHNAKKQ
ncbi:hypothetical protein BDD12DRAFT_893767 [Trichophaea hybrida]|nr:hypothetical protein BDD12DRAFT_893767 [Trichophaea hybrida]